MTLMEPKWLLLAYQLPREPSRSRVAVWRRLRKLGAVHMEEGFWLMPNAEHLRTALTDIVATIHHEGGTVSAFSAQGFPAGEDEELIARFNQARELEYKEFAHECDKFLAHIQKETREENYEFFEAEEIEEDLAKLDRWLGQVKDRDFFAVGGRSVAEQHLRQCRDILADFMEKSAEREA